jgi:hypothetical protein
MNQNTILRQLLRHVPKFQAVVFQRIGPCAQRLSIFDQYLNARLNRPQLMKDRRDILSQQLLLEAYRADHQWNYFCAPIWEWSINNFGLKGLREEAFLSFNHSTGSLLGFLMCGHSALEPLLRLLIKSKELMDTWISIGGVLSLLNGAVCVTFSSYLQLIF